MHLAGSFPFPTGKGTHARTLSGLTGRLTLPKAEKEDGPGSREVRIHLGREGFFPWGGERRNEATLSHMPLSFLGPGMAARPLEPPCGHRGPRCSGSPHQPPHWKGGCFLLVQGSGLTIAAAFLPGLNLTHDGVRTGPSLSTRGGLPAPSSVGRGEASQVWWGAGGGAG